ncbi:MAG: lytic transglycosylase domain-containing protein [Oligoflexia bacterium]|nr:lytic transglycosylase domain-containing protein [Oligoflexia bacterium]
MLSTWALASLLSLSAAAPAHAVYDHPVAWSDISELDLRPVLRSQYGSEANLLDPQIPAWVLDLALRDADNLVGPEFKVPNEIKGAVGFWLRIYTIYTTKHVVIFDSRHPEIIYDVLDFRELARTARNAVVYEILSKNRVKKAMAAYRKAFARLASRPNPKNPTPEERSILAALAKSRHKKHPFKELARNLRSQTGQRDNIVKGLLAAEAFFPKMEELFAKNEVPRELTRLALVESSFNLHAISYAGASGVWQFMENPGRRYLLIDRSARIDERLSPLKSTVAAAKLLHENYRRFGSWALSVTSYNHGLRGLMKLRKAHARDFGNIAYLFDACARKSPLGWAARNYYAEFLAVLHAESYRKLFYGEPPVQPIRPVVFRAAAPGKTALTLAMESGIALHEFKLLNPDIRDLRRTLPPGFLIAVPGESDDFAMLSEKRKEPKRASLGRGNRKSPA